MRFTEAISNGGDRWGQTLFPVYKPNLSRGMQYLLSGYANWYAKRHQRTGHLFQGRFKAELDEDYRRFVDSGLATPPSSPLDNALEGWLLGSDTFLQKIKKLLTHQTTTRRPDSEGTTPDEP